MGVFNVLKQLSKMVLYLVSKKLKVPKSQINRIVAYINRVDCLIADIQNDLSTDGHVSYKKYDHVHKWECDCFIELISEIEINSDFRKVRSFMILNFCEVILGKDVEKIKIVVDLIEYINTK